MTAKKPKKVAKKPTSPRKKVATKKTADRQKTSKQAAHRERDASSRSTAAS
jgi:hypothetical protein